MGFTKTICDFAVETKLRNCPSQAVQNAKAAILDTIGVSIAGKSTLVSKLVLVYIKESLNGKGISSIFTTGIKTSSEKAAFVNGIMAHAHDWDDAAWSMTGHPSAPMLPALIALGEQENISGEEILEAYIVGFEIMGKIGILINPAQVRRGWHPTATLGVLGAAIGSGKLLKLTTEEMRSCFGIAASQASGLRQNFGTDTKAFHCGHAARNGIIAAKLAQKGVFSDRNIVESDMGIIHTFAGESQADMDKVIDALGNPLDILNPGLAIKRFPCSTQTHAAILCTLYLLEKHSIDYRDVSKVSCGLNHLSSKSLIRTNPKKGTEGKYSIQFCLAIALIDGMITPSQFTDEKAQSPEVQDLMTKVNTYTHPELTNIDMREGARFMSAEVKIKLKNGNSYSHKITSGYSIPLFNKNGFFSAELLKKFADCTINDLSENSQKKVIESVFNIESFKTIKELTSLFG